MSNDEILESIIDAGFVAKIDGGNVVVDLNASKASSGASDLAEALGNLKSWSATNGFKISEAGDIITVSA